MFAYFSERKKNILVPKDFHGVEEEQKRKYNVGIKKHHFARTSGLKRREEITSRRCLNRQFDEGDKKIKYVKLSKYNNIAKSFTCLYTHRGSYTHAHVCMHLCV